MYVPYTRYHNLLLITNRSWILTIHKDRKLWKNLLENKEKVFKNGVKNILAASYIGARMVLNDISVLSLNFLNKRAGRLFSLFDIFGGWNNFNDWSYFSPQKYRKFSSFSLTVHYIHKNLILISLKLFSFIFEEWQLSCQAIIID